MEQTPAHLREATATRRRATRSATGPVGGVASGADAAPLLRPRLLARLDRAVDLPVVLIAAATGYGKTTLLRRWADATALPVAWVDIEPGETLSGLVARFAAVLAPIVPGLDAAVRSAAPLAAAEALWRDLARSNWPVVLVVDDLHLLTDREASQFLDALVADPPLSLRLVLSTRAEPEWAGLRRLRARRQVADLREADLAMTPEEARRLLEGATDAPGLVALDAALVRNEGWPVGVALLRERLLAGDPPDVAAPAAAAEGAALVVALHDAQPLAVQQVLRLAGITRRLEPGLVDALLGGPLPGGSRALLDTIARHHLLVSRLPGRHDTYRPHHVLHDAMRDLLLEREGRRAVADLHRRARAWRADRGEIDDAVRHAAAAGDEAELVDLVERHGFDWLGRSVWGSTRAWLAAIPPDRVRQRPALLAMQAVDLITRGEATAALAVCDDAEALLAAEPGDPARAAGLRAEVASVRLRARAHRDSVIASPEDAEPLLRAPGISRFGRGGAVAVWWRGMLRSGRAAEATEWLGSELARSGDAADAYTMNLLLAVAGIAAQTLDAERVVWATDALIRLDPLVEHHRLAKWAAAYRGIFAYEQNRLGEAESGLRDAVATEPGTLIVVEQEAVAFLAPTLVARGRSDEARGLLEERRRFLARGSGAAWLPGFAQTAARTALLAGDLAAAERWLLGVGEQPCPEPTHISPPPAVDAAAVLLTRGHAGDAARAADLLETVVARSRDFHLGWHLARTLPLLALARRLTGDRDGATAALVDAFEVDPGLLLRRFLDHGEPMAGLLADLRDADSRLAAPVDRVLRAFAAPVSAVGAVRLSPREQDVLRGLARGERHREIADHLGISPGQARKYASDAYRKLGATSREEAIGTARELGLLPRR